MLTTFCNNRGTILIELMISVMLSLVLLLSFFELFIFIERNIHQQAALNQIQHNAETVIGALRSSIHQAGYIGCARLTADFPIHNNTAYSLTSRNKIQALNAGPLIVRHASNTHATLLKTMQDHFIIHANKTIHFYPNDVLLISDCKSADIFKVKYVYTTRGMQKMMPDTALHHAYAKNSEIARLVWNEYRIESAKNNHKKTLYMEDIHHQKIPLVDDVEEIHIDATVRQDSSYKEISASQVDDWSKVVGLSIALTLSAPPYKKRWYTYIWVNE